MASDGPQFGTEDLEAGMRASRAVDSITIASIALAILMVFNSQTLVAWTRQPQPGPGIAALERSAVIWDSWMQWLGAAPAMKALRRDVQSMIEP